MLIRLKIGDDFIKTKFLTAILSIALLMSVFGSSLVGASLATSNPIAINGNAGLTGLPGSGSASDPWRIANLSIDGHGGVGISISNVDQFVSIYNCTIYNSSTGIQITGSSNIIIDKNTINGAMGSHGIFLNSSTATVDRNKLTDCSIELRHGDSNAGVQDFIEKMAISSSNTVNGAAVYFLKNQNMANASVTAGAGEVILLNVTYANVNAQNMHGGAVIFWGSHITVANCVITGTFDGIYVFSSDYCTLNRNQIVDPWHAGVRLYLSSHGMVSNITVSHHFVSSTAYGIVVYYGSNNVVVDNSVRDTFDGFDLSHTTSNTVSRNFAVHSTGEGIYVESSNGNTISSNQVNGSSLKGIHTQLSNNNVIFNNTITGARNGGIVVWKSFANTINGNKITGSVSYGINLTACNGGVDTIYANVLIGNNGSSSVFGANTIQAYDDNANHWNNATIGNYWGDWTAPDANKNGIVDSAYVIAGNKAVDNYPVALSVKIQSPSSNLYTNSASVLLSGITTGYVTSNVNWHNQASGASGLGSGTSSWTASVGLVLGINNITVNATDSQGLKVSDHVIVTYDTHGSNLAIISPASNSYNNTGSVTLQWNAVNDVSGIAKTEVSTDGTTWTIVTGTRHVMTLADGAYTETVKVTDNAGNVNQTSVSFTVDRVKPVVVISSPVNGTTNTTGSVTLQWNASDATSGIANTEVSSDGTTWTNVTGNSTVLTLADGTYTVHLKVTDKASHVNQTSAIFTVDTVKPVVVISSPVNGTTNTNGSVLVQWNASDATSGIAKTEISSDGTTWTTVTGNSTVLNLTDSSYTLTVKVTDKAGNVNQTSVSLTVESSTPTIITKYPVGTGAPKAAKISVLFSEPMNKTATTITVNGITGVVTWIGNNATFTPSSALAYNTVYTVNVSGKDLSGKALNSTSWTFTTLKDECKITSTLKDASGKAIAGAKVTLSNGMNTTTDANGYFEFTNVTSGLYTLTISKDGYKTITQSVPAVAGETTALGTLSAQSNAASSDDTLLIAGGAIGIVALLAIAFLVLRRRKN